MIAVALAAAAGLHAVWDRGDQQSRADPNDAKQVAVGRQLYDAACASCHGRSLEGQANWQTRLPDGFLPAPPHDESGHTWHHPDRILFRITKLGAAAEAPAGYRTNMPGFSATLSDEEIWAILAYIKSTWPEHIRQRQADISARHKG